MVMRRRFTTSAIPEDLQDPYYLGMHRKAVMSSMYGMNNVIKVDLQDNKVKFVLNTTGVAYDSAQEAFEKAGQTGMTTFARLTGVMETSSENLRGLSGLSQRLIQMQDTLNADRALAQRLNISDPSKLFFEVGSFKMPMGKKEATRNIIDQLNSGIIVPDDGAFNILRVFEGTAGQDPVELSIEQTSRLFLATSGGAGGILSTSELQKALSGDNAQEAMAGLMQKVGKRVKGIIALKDVSLAGEDLASALSGLGTGQTTLNEKTVRIFKPAEELKQIAIKYLSDPSARDEASLLKAFDSVGNDQLARELKAFYSGTGAIEAVIERLNNVGITSVADFLNEEKAKAFKMATESAFDGTSVINSKVSNSMRSAMQRELNKLQKDMAEGKIGAESLPRIKELISQLDNFKYGQLEATTGRVFMTIGGEARMIKAVFDSAGFKSELSQYGILTTDVALKKETGLMGQVDSINLVLHGDPSSLVYQDPLMPAFHSAVYDKTFEEAQELRRARILSDYRAAIETGEISKKLKSRIYKDAGMDISGLPEAVRNQQSRNKMYAQRLKEAIESGLDLRTMPELLNYVKKHTESQLYRLKDGMYQPALEDTFRFAIDTEQSYYAGRQIANKARLGSGLETIQLADGRELRALTFQIQGHKMLFGGDAASIFKQSFGGFDLDDHGIVMPRIFTDVSGNKRLGTFMFRQPTGPAEFVFGKADFGNSDTIKAFLEENDVFGKALDDLISDTKIEQSKKYVYSLLKNALDPDSKVGADIILQDFNNLNRGTATQAGALEQSIIDVMERAQSFGYKMQTIDAAKLFAGKKTGAYAAGVSFGKEEFENLLQSGFTKDRLEERFLVNQYNQGVIRRAFVEKGAFSIDNDFTTAIKGAVGESIYNSRLRGLEQQGVAYLNAVGNLMNDQSLAESIQVAIESSYLAKARDATKSADSIGTYINRLTVASAGSDQMQDILKVLEESGVSKSVSESITKKYIMAVAPSDIVDLIVNLNGTKGIGLDTTAEVMRAFYENATDTDAAQQAIARVMGIQNIKDTSIVDALGSEMIRAKGELIATLRASVMRNVDEAKRAELMAGLDEEFMRQRLSGSDVSDFITAMQRQYKSEYADILDGKDFIAGTDQKIIDDYNAVMELSRGSAEEQKQNLIRFMGLGENSAYAPLSKAARIGRQAKEAIDAETARFAVRRTTAFASEINMSSDAMQLSENILKSYSSMLEQNYDNINSLIGDSEAMSEFFKYKKNATLMQINDKVYSMIYQAAEINENVTVGQLADNMEFLMNSRYPKLRSLMNAQIFDERDNNINKMFTGARYQRRLRNAAKQGRASSLVEQYMSMVQAIKSDSATRDDVIEGFKQSLSEIQATSPNAKLTDEMVMKAAAIHEFSDVKDFSLLGLIQDNENMVKDLLGDADARRFLDESGIEELLNFGRGSDALGFAPPEYGPMLDTEDLRAITLGEEGVEVVNPSTYKRITDGWKDTKLYEAFGNPTIKKSTYAAVALVAASLLYSGAKDRTQDDISGPPLLPGGSSYEQMAQRQANMPNVSMFSSYNQGTSYAVNIEGSQDQIDSFSSVAGANGSSTIYKGIPQLGRDPYSTLAGSI